MKFRDIPGHENVKRRLVAMADAGHIPHALLLEGVEGIGKLAMARVFAQYIHCKNRQPDGEPCGVCPSCLQHQSHNHPDLFFSYPIYKKTSENPVSEDYIDDWNEFLDNSPYAAYQDWVNQLNPETKQLIIYNSEGNSIIRKVSVKPYSAKERVMIMWLPEKMKEECANRLLKMIEEPYEDTILLFVSNRPEEILPTIYSRVQRIKMRRLSDETVADYLTQTFAIDPAIARAVAGISEGSLVRAVEYLNSTEENEEFLNSFKQLMRMAFVKDVRGLKIWSEDVAGYKREKALTFLQYVGRMVRENFINNIGNRSLNYMTPTEAVFSSKFSPYINERNVSVITEETELASKEIAANANAKIVLFDYALKLIIALRM